MPKDSTGLRRKDFEIPLLRSLIEMGGQAEPSDELYRRVGSKLNLPPEQMQYDAVHARVKWVYHLQWVRHTLIKKGEIDGSERGIWRVTSAGRDRVNSEGVVQ